MNYAVLVFSVAFQFTAAVLAWRLIRVTGRRWAWVLIAAAMLFMTARRAVVLYGLASGHALYPSDVASEWVGLVISALVLAGVASIAPLFRSIQRSEAALRESEQQYRSTLEAMGDAIHVVDPDLRITLFNTVFTRWCKELNLPTDTLGHTFSEVFPFLPDSVREEYRQVFASGEVLATDEHIAIAGREIITETRKIPIFEGGRVARVATVVRDVTERRQTENRLRAEKEFSESMLASLPGTLYVFDDNGRFVRWNENVEAITGYSSQEIPQMNPLDFFCEREKAVVAERIQEVFTKGQSTIEAMILCKDGTEIPQYLTGVRCEIEGKPCLLGMGVDITERKQAEERLRTSEANYRAIFDATSDAICVHDIESGAILDVNRRMQEMYGYSPDEARCLNIGVLSAGEPPYTQNEAVRWIVKAAGGAPQLFEWRAKDKSGRLFWVDVSLQRVTLEGQERMLAVVRDISKRKQAEAELKESQRALATLMSNLPGMAYRCRNDRDWTMEFVSDGCLALTGYPPADVIENRKVSYAQLILDEDRESVWSDVQNALGENRPFQLTYRIVTADGSVKWTWEQGQGVYDTDDNLVALEGFITDITERRRLEEQLHQAQKMEAVGALAGGLAHDFNNILTAILGNAELLNAGLADPALNIRTLRERTREGLAQIEWAGQRAASLTRQLLAFSRRQVIRPQVLNLNDILRAMQDMLRRLSGEDVHLTMNLHANIDSIKADCGQVEQVVLNLMINARDAMSDGGTLEVETESVVLTERDVSEDAHPGPHVMLAVTDTGCGMSEDVVERIFEPFFTTKQLGKGTGLGLSTVFGIVRQAGGTIRVQSKPGEGTTFRVYWPRAEEAVRELVAAVAAVPRGSETILVAEDEDSIRHLTHRILEERGYTVLSAPNGTQAIEVAKEHAGTIHLLITDVIMPDINGVRLAQTLMAVRPDMKVLYLSGYTSDVIADRGVLKEGVEFIQKPFAGEMLARRAREVLDKERPTTS